MLSPYEGNSDLVDDRKYWLAFSLIPTIGPKRINHLRNQFESLARAWAANEHQLRRAGLEQQPIQNLLQMRHEIDPDAEMAKVERVGAWIITLDDAQYPGMLREVPGAPAVLYVRGTLTTDDVRALSIVGTRKATNYGRDVAHHLAYELVQNGVTVVSGLALGIDTAAHRGALDAGGRTIAVLGCGIDRIYPRENHALAHEIVTSGALISEFPVGTPPEARNFPRRNRVISGLALGILVVEAPRNSGALITASTAADQGREVFAVPGNIFNPNSHGPNGLIQDGAKLVMNVGDILAELDIAHTNIQAQHTTRHIQPDNEVEAALLQHLGTDPIHIDDLARLSGLPIAVITSTLTLLELKGLARTEGPMQYCLVHNR